jgi:hypothetical protein
VRQRGTLVTTVDPPTTRPTNGQAIFFVVEPDRGQLTELARRKRAGRLRTIIGAVRPLTEASDAFNSAHRVKGRTIIQVTK